MFVDYVSLMLVNMVAGFFVLAHFVHAGIDQDDRRRWAPAFAAVGAVALITGTHMALTWPIPKLDAANLSFANIAFGETTVLFGVLFLSAAWACASGLRLDVISICAFFFGLVAIVIGAQIWRLGLTHSPRLTGLGFAVSGLSGILFCPLVWYLRDRRAARTVLALLMGAAGLIWAFVAYSAYWSHIARFSKL